MNWDLLFDHCLLVTAKEDDAGVIEDGSLAIKDGKIAFIGKSNLIQSSWRESTEEVIDGKGKLLLMPGLINAHTHHPMSLFRSLANDLPVDIWLHDHVWPLEAKYVSPEFVELGTKLSLLEMIKSGSTVFNDMYFYINEVAKAADSVGVRGFIGSGVLDFATKFASNVDHALEQTEEFIKTWRYHPRIHPTVAPHAPMSCELSTYEKSKQLADRYKVMMHTHLCEGQQKEFVAYANESSIQVLDKAGLLDAKVILAHAIHVDEKDLETLQDRKVSVCHNPESNMKLASGVAPVHEFLKRGIPCALGTDGPASNNELSMFSTMKTTAMLHKVWLKDTTVVSAKETFEMATMGGAKALGLEKVLGSLEEGKLADLAVIDLNRPHLTPCFDPHSIIVYSMQASDVIHTLVDGKFIMRDRVVQGLDEQAILEEARTKGKEMKIADQS